MTCRNLSKAPEPGASGIPSVATRLKFLTFAQMMALANSSCFRFTSTCSFLCKSTRVRVGEGGFEVWNLQGKNGVTASCVTRGIWQLQYLAESVVPSLPVALNEHICISSTKLS